MLNINELNTPAFSLSDDKDEFYFNTKFSDLDTEIKENILKNFREKNLIFVFQEKNFHIIELASNVFIINSEAAETHRSIREATKHSLALQMRILNELGEGVFIEDQTGKIIFVNPSAEKILDLVSYEIVGQSFLSFIYPDEEKIRIQRTLYKITSDLNDNRSIRFETQIRKKNSELVYLLVIYSIMMTSKSVEGALITIYDISDMKKLTKEIQERSNELIQAEKLTSIGLLASGISHELNNPLAFIMSNNSTLEDYITSIIHYTEKWDNLFKSFKLKTDVQLNLDEISKLARSNEIDVIKKEVFDILKANQRGLHRLSEVISDLRKFSHANKEDSEKKEVLNIIEPIKLALNLLSYELKSINVEIHKDNEKKTYLILGNTKLYQIFLNIIYNASQAISENHNKNNKGLIKINIYEANKKVVIQISDTGIGISEKSLPRIFDPFYTTKPPGIGTGLGLSISQRIISDLGGYIVAESGTILNGATFTLYFPIYEKN